MEEKLVIEIYRKKDPEELTRLLSEPESKLDLGSAAALAAADACAMGLRAAKRTATEVSGNERLDYILRNLEKLREYMVYLIDEDVKCRSLLRRAEKKGDEREIDAARQPACCICEEIINQMGNTLNLLSELADLGKQGSMYISAAVHMSMAAMQSAMAFVLDMSAKSSDDNYVFVTRRENEITLENYSSAAQAVLAKLNN